MTNDDLFRLILLVIFFAFVPFALYHRIRSKTDEKLDRWQEGAFILFGLRLGAIHNERPKDVAGPIPSDFDERIFLSRLRISWALIVTQVYFSCILTIRWLSENLNCIRQSHPNLDLMRLVEELVASVGIDEEYNDGTDDPSHETEIAHLFPARGASPVKSLSLTLPAHFRLISFQVT